jgi:putative ATPase
VFDLKPLEAEDLRKLLERALADDARGIAHVPHAVDDDALAAISQNARGDARRALSALELASDFAQSAGVEALTVAIVQEALATQTLLYDKSGEEHYNVISAFIKSMRGSDPDAAVYWLMRMLEAGEDPLFVLRRMLIFASEDIGNADPRALEVTVSADAAFRRLGMPEGIFPIAQCCTYLASAPKSNASYKAWKMAQADVREHGALAVPLKLRNAPTEAMKSWGYGEGYRYPHDDSGFSPGETYLPDELIDRRYYRPTDHGFEARIRERLNDLRATPKAKGGGGSGAPHGEKP